MRGDQIDDVIVSAILDDIFSQSNLKKYKTLIDESVKSEQKEVESSLRAINKGLQEIEDKKIVYFEGLESGQLEMALVAERLKSLKEEEDRLTLRKSESERKLQQFSSVEDFNLSEEQYAELQETLNFFRTKAEPRQIRQFLQGFISSIIVHEEKLKVEYFPPSIPQKKDPATTDLDEQGLSHLDLAVPTGLEPVSSA